MHAVTIVLRTAGPWTRALGARGEHGGQEKGKGNAMGHRQPMKAVVVYESFFGNSERIARAVTSGLGLEGLTATAVDVADARDVDVAACDLLVVGGPTHGFALSRTQTRHDAVTRGGSSTDAGRGIREWLTDLPVPPGTHLAAAFDTRARTVRHLPMSAARSAAHLLRQRGFTLVARPAGFVVLDVEGPLVEHEPERAVAWGRELGRAAQAAGAVREGEERRPGGA